jgi:hypothetical protein
MSLPVPTSVTLDNAISWTTNWRVSTHELKANSFLFDADEIATVLSEEGVVKVRMYLGLQVSEKDNTLVEKMLCVGVGKDGKDIIVHKPVPSDGPTGTGIYDFSHPCPPVCEDLGSPLGG